MNLPYRIDLLARLGEYLLSDEEGWQLVKERAGLENSWFIPAFTEKAVQAIAHSFLQKDRLQQWAESYALPPQQSRPRQVGIIMAGNIPLVGFHDFLTVFISGHHALIKPSAKDAVLIRHLVEKLWEWEPRLQETLQFADMLKGCDAYIATGSNNSSRYFEYYFARFPHIIRRNRTSVAVLRGTESTEELSQLADDVHLYFGLGCRNVTKIFVPGGYDFTGLIAAFRKYNWLAENHKYQNNYDYNLAIVLLNKKFYMSSGSLLLVEDPAIFSPIGQLHYEFYSHNDELAALLPPAQDLQTIIGKGFVPFGAAQEPGLRDYADGVDTMKFLMELD